MKREDASWRVTALAYYGVFIFGAFETIETIAPRAWVGWKFFLPTAIPASLALGVVIGSIVAYAALFLIFAYATCARKEEE